MEKFLEYSVNILLKGSQKTAKKQGIIFEEPLSILRRICLKNSSKAIRWKYLQNPWKIWEKNNYYQFTLKHIEKKVWQKAMKNIWLTSFNIKNNSSERIR